MFSNRATDGGKTVPNGKTMSFSQDLVELYKRINELQDGDTLQKIVDIVEHSGTFELTSTTFDFDLCILDSVTLESIKQFLDNT